MSLSKERQLKRQQLRFLQSWKVMGSLTFLRHLVQALTKMKSFVYRKRTMILSRKMNTRPQKREVEQKKGYRAQKSKFLQPLVEAYRGKAEAIVRIPLEGST